VRGGSSAAEGRARANQANRLLAANSSGHYTTGPTRGSLAVLFEESKRFRVMVS
jgi:hypothetical protein